MNVTLPFGGTLGVAVLHRLRDRPRRAAGTASHIFIHGADTRPPKTMRDRCDLAPAAA